MITVSHNQLSEAAEASLVFESSVLLKIAEMTAQKRSLPSFASVISVLSIVLYCAGFLRVELELNEHKRRINALENAAEAKTPTSEPNLANTTKNVDGKFVKY